MADGLDREHPDILIDYDSTILDPETNKPEEGVKEALERIRSVGLRVVVSSARTSTALYDPERIKANIEEMEAFLKEHDLPFDEIDDGTQGKRPRAAYVGNEAIAYRRRRNWLEISTLIVPVSGLQMIAMMGFPGSGKSTLSKRLMQHDGTWVRVNLDEISAMVGSDDYLASRRVYHRIEMEAIRAGFENGKHVLIDRTNLSREKRSRWPRIAREYGVRCTLAFVSIPVEEYKARNADRPPGTFVDSQAYENHWDSFEVPDLSKEDFDELIIVDGNFKTEVHQVKKPDGQIVNITEPSPTAT